MYLASVCLGAPGLGNLAYRIPARFEKLLFVGCRVKVPLKNTVRTGFVLATSADGDGSAPTIREILNIVDLVPVLSARQIQLAEFVSEYYLAPLYESLSLMVPGSLKNHANPLVSLAKSRHVRKSQTGHQERRRPDIPIPGLSEGPVFLSEALSMVGTPIETLRELKNLADSGVLHMKFQGSEYELLASQLIHDPETNAPISRDTVAINPSAYSIEGDQRIALDAAKQALLTGKFAAILLQGKTGSGKTEVYIRLIEESIRLTKSSIVLVPEIGLLPSIAEQLVRRFGDRVVEVIHSGMTPSAKCGAWRRIRSGAISIVVGPRSAVFAPLDNLGLIVVDEEHDSSYKQESNPRYNGRDIAIVRARQESSVALLVSATPSLESIQNVQRGRYLHLRLEKRFGVGKLPSGQLIDLRQHVEALVPGNALISHELQTSIANTLAAGDQVLILRNRRGYAPILLCRACGFKVCCENCALPYSVHAKSNLLRCHYCDGRRQIPNRCPQCSEESLEPIGVGTERVEERLRQLFPESAIDVLDSDIAERPGELPRILNEFAKGNTQILVGTQMIAKGHNFPGVALSVILSADGYLAFPDFRAAERTFALLTQMAGRAGRGTRPGAFILQTFSPDHYAIQATFDESDGNEFYRKELDFRRTYSYPPFSKMVSVLARSSNKDASIAAIEEFSRLVSISPHRSSILVQGPAPAPYELLRGKWRFQIILRSKSGTSLRSTVRSAASNLPRNLAKLISIDVDPLSLL